MSGQHAHYDALINFYQLDITHKNFKPKYIVKNDLNKTNNKINNKRSTFSCRQCVIYRNV